jgi:hypothetical protein
MKKGIAGGEQDAPGRPRLVDQGGEGEPRLTLGVSGEHDDRLRHRRLSRSSPHDDDLRRRESSSLAHQGCPNSRGVEALIWGMPAVGIAAMPESLPRDAVAYSQQLKSERSFSEPHFSTLR